jgi:hypothetical protein
VFVSLDSLALRVTSKYLVLAVLVKITEFAVTTFCLTILFVTVKSVSPEKLAKLGCLVHYHHVKTAENV